MPQIRITKELTSTCQHQVNHKRRFVIAILLVLLAASISALIAGCILEIRWAIIGGIFGIGAIVLALIITMDLMRKDYIRSREQEIILDHVTIIDDTASTLPNIYERDAKVQRIV